VWFNAQRGNYGENVPLVQVTPSSRWLWEGRRTEMIYTAHPSGTANCESQNLCSVVWVSGTRSPLIQTSECGKRAARETNWL